MTPASRRALVVAAFVFPLSGGAAGAATIEELQNTIATRNSDIATLEHEIAEYQRQLDVVGKEKLSLQNTIIALDLSRKKLSADIKITEHRISAADTRLIELGLEINLKEGSITTSGEGVLRALQTLEEVDRVSPVLMVLGGEDLSASWNYIEEIGRFQTQLRDRLAQLRALKQNLQNSKRETEITRRNLAQYQRDLVNQKKALDTNRQEKAQLLSLTKNKEANYKKLIEEKTVLREQFEQEVLAYQSQLKLTIDPSLLPRVGSGILRWPVDRVVITQYFGNTDFATKNPQVYNGRGHNGIDLRASPGTPIKAALEGTIIGLGDTDLACPNASYGRWVLVRHNNGLSTLYAHLSTIVVSEGQSIATGQALGYSGSTGYATGPHLHFAVFATQGVKVAQLPSKALACRGRVYTLPLADIRAYLNPLSYL